MKIEKEKIFKMKGSKKNKKIIYITSLLLIILYYFIYYRIFFFHPNEVQINEDKYTNNIYSTKVCLCMICKLENLYIKEFIEHYRKLGYNHIFIYDNNDIDGERFEDVIQKEIDEGFITIINYRGDTEKPQFRAFIDCYEKNNNNYDWLSFFDTDEFLELKPKGINIQEFLNQERFKNCQSVKFNWLTYSDNDKINYENKPIQERFTKYLFNSNINIHIKSTVRGNLPTNYWIGAWNPHSGVNNYNSCNPSGKQIPKNSPYIFPTYKYGFLKHYRTKTIEEFVKKMKKGRADAPMNYTVLMKKFFAINNKTKEKLDIFKKEFNISFN